MGEASSGHFAHLATEGISPEEQDLAEVRWRMRKEFPRWSVWRSRRRDGGLGSWRATCGQELTCQEMYRGLARTLVCDSLAQLREELVMQTKLEN